jgi:hypothetical protein
MSEIDLPSLKQTLWQKLRSDLVSLIPWFADDERLLCPTCLRPLKFDDFSLEHTIPRQALADDPIAVRATISVNQRSGVTLLCRKQLAVKNKRVPGHGCNSWKGKFYDPFLKEVFRVDFLQQQINSRHQIALFATSYLGLFGRYGYQVSLLPSGLLMRRQFFQPNTFLREIPISCQMVVAGSPPMSYDDNTHDYWSEPFRIVIERDAALVVVRDMAQRLPMSRDLRIPLARTIPYVPSKYAFRPDLTTVFE